MTTVEAAERFNREEAQQVGCYATLGLAIALNRTLIMPRMLCYCDNIWKEMSALPCRRRLGMTLPFDLPCGSHHQSAEMVPGRPAHTIQGAGLPDGPSPLARDQIVVGALKDVTIRRGGEVVARAVQGRARDRARRRARSLRGFEDASKASLFKTLAPALVPYSRHFATRTDSRSDASPLRGAYPFTRRAAARPAATSRASTSYRHLPLQHRERLAPLRKPQEHGGVEKLEVPADYPDLSPNPRSRQYHKIDDESEGLQAPSQWQCRGERAPSARRVRDRF